uniref:Reverse transcriptase domain-containing protein n=1 Tax=Tanacetum cinerariifolium TaxID=118510 RepID=A0A6L2NW08_TANCI|nr:reverse transcriptase domain-containing protein [Tanacetum cinerariifolium]
MRQPPLPMAGKSELKCKSLAGLGASINLMPLSVWKKLGLPELIFTRMTLELANRAICTPAEIARDVFVLVGKFTFPAGFVIVDYESDPRVPLILGRSFLRIARALIDVHGEEMILRDEPRVHMPNVLTTHPTLMLDSDFIPSDNSLPEYEIFYFDIEEKNNGSTTIHADISLLDLECFNFEIKPDPGELTSIVDSGIREIILSATNVNLPPRNIIFLFLLMLYGSFSLFSRIQWFLQIFSHSGMKIPFLTPASPIIISLLYCRMYLIGVKLS